MKLSRVTCMLCAALLLAQQVGCAWLGLHNPITNNLPDTRGAGLEWGMTEEEVRSVIGNPDRVSEQGKDWVQWYYNEYCLRQCAGDKPDNTFRLFLTGVLSFGLVWLTFPPSQDWLFEFKYGRLASYRSLCDGDCREKCPACVKRQ